MSYEIYKLIHFFALFCLFLAIGGLLFRSKTPVDQDSKGSDTGLDTDPDKNPDKDRASKKPFRQIMILHGTAVFILLVSGFGMMARLKMSTFPLWLILKLVIWLILGVLTPVLLARYKGNKIAILLLVLVSAGGAIYLAIFKPF